MEHRLMIDPAGTVVLLHVKMPDKVWTQAEQQAQTSYTVEVFYEDGSPLTQASSPESAREARTAVFENLAQLGYRLR